MVFKKKIWLFIVLSLIVLSVIALFNIKKHNFRMPFAPKRLEQSINNIDNIVQIYGFDAEGDMYVSTNIDPWILVNTSGCPDFAYIEINITKKNPAATSAQIFYEVSGANFSEENSVRTSLSVGQNIIKLPLAKYDYLRLDLAEQEGVLLEIGSIKVSDKVPPDILSATEVLNIVLFDLISIAVLYIFIFKFTVYLSDDDLIFGKTKEVYIQGGNGPPKPALESK